MQYLTPESSQAIPQQFHVASIRLFFPVYDFNNLFATIFVRNNYRHSQAHLMSQTQRMCRGQATSERG